MIGLRTNEGGAREKSAVEGERVADLDRRRCGGNGGLFRLLADRETGIALDDGELGTASARIDFSVRPVGMGASRRRGGAERSCSGKHRQCDRTSTRRTPS